MTNIFYKKCPIKGCNTISGFCLDIKEISKNEKYFCQECCNESPLKKWENSNQESMNKQIRARKLIKKGMIDKSYTYSEIKMAIETIFGRRKNPSFIADSVKEIKAELNNGLL